MTQSAGNRKNVDSRAGVQSLETGLRVLMAFVGAEPMPMLKSIADRSQMHPAKVHRYLVSLCRTGFVEQDTESSRYRLSEASLRLGIAALNRFDVVRVARPVLGALRDQFGQSLMLAIWGSEGATVALQEIVAAPITITVAVGSVLPPLRSSTGRTFLAWLPPAQTASVLDRELTALRKSPVMGCPSSMAEVRDLLEEIRRRGLARVEGQFSPGVQSMSAPIRDFSGRLTAVLSVVGPVGRFDLAWNGAVARRLKLAADALSRELGGDSRPGSADMTRDRSAT